MEKIILVVLIVIGALFLIAKFPGIAIIVIGIIVFFVSIIVIKSVQYSENKKIIRNLKNNKKSKILPQ
jgi:predicted signal transduction protein with EAL and GGDEF domain